LKTINLGIIGLGRIGKVHLTHATHHFPNCRVIAAARVHPEKKEWVARCGVSRFYDDFTSLVQDPDLDAIIIASPTGFHATHIEQAAKAGKAIFCEKPLDLSFSVVKKVVQTVKKANIPFMLGFNRRFDPTYCKLKDALQTGKVGTPHLLRITSRDPGPPPVEYLKTSGGLFLDMAIHDFDMARYLLDDEVETVYTEAAVLGEPRLKAFHDVDTAITTLRCKKGTLVTIDNSRNSAYGYDQRIEVFGEKGVWGATNPTATFDYHSNAQGTHSPTLLPFFMERYEASYRLEMGAFLKYISEGGPSPVSAEEGLQSMAISIAAQHSVDENRVVSLSEIINN
jgi:myo-inositol 2-dehydrogenase/D-chiro-inositol 1-dehydrogenase